MSIQKRLEICCGEAPYLVSLYDTVNGEYMQPENRIGILDRKLRIINENVGNDDDWQKWVIRAFQSVYGYEFQGDSLLLARENVFYTYIEHYYRRFNVYPSKDNMLTIANILSWNLWQMDGLKAVVPFTCVPKNDQNDMQISLFDEDDDFYVEPEEAVCPGCRKQGFDNHIGVYCKLQDWRSKTSVLFADIFRR